MRNIFNFGRKIEPSTAPATPAEEIQRIEGEIARLQREASAARSEAADIALTDPARSVELDSTAAQAETLIARLLAGLPRFYEARRAQAFAQRDSEIDTLISLEADRARGIAAQIKALSVEIVKKLNDLHALSLGLPEAYGVNPPALNGAKLHVNELQAERDPGGRVFDLSAEAVSAKIERALSEYIADLEWSRASLKASDRAGEPLYASRPAPITLSIRTRLLSRGLPPFEAPPAEPEPAETEQTAAEVAG